MTAANEKGEFLESYAILTNNVVQLKLDYKKIGYIHFLEVI